MAALQGNFANSDNFIWPNKASEYELEDNILGQGASATVHKARCQDKVCAIKKIDLEQTKDESDVVKEIKTLGSFKHENITAYYGCFLNQSKLWIVMELMDAGTVHSIISNIEKHRRDTGEKTNEPIINETSMAIILREVLKGIQYLHSENCIHRDVKAQNILLNLNGEVKLADFGVSSLSSVGGFGGGGKGKQVKTFVGTPCWMAPEVGDVEKHSVGYDSKADMWSFGITCIEMITGKPPYFDMAPIKVILLTIQSNPVNPKVFCEEKGFKISKNLNTLIEYNLKKSPKERPTAATLLRHDKFIEKAAKRKDWKQDIIALITGDASKLSKPGKVVRSLRGERDKVSGQWKFNLDSGSECGDSLSSSLSDLDQGVEYSENERIDQSTSVGGLDQNIKASQNHNGVITPEILQSIQRTQNLSVTLRIRTDVTGQLNDIKFPFVRGTDTAESLAKELCEAELVSSVDQDLVSQAMDACVKTGLNQTFKLSLDGDIESDEIDLIGYARISLNLEGLEE